MMYSAGGISETIENACFFNCFSVLFSSDLWYNYCIANRRKDIPVTYEKVVISSREYEELEGLRQENARLSQALGKKASLCRSSEQSKYLDADNAVLFTRSVE